MEQLNTKKFSQIGIIVRDLEKARKVFAQLFDSEIPSIHSCGGPQAHTQYKGKPAPKAKSLLAFIDLAPGIQLELIEPTEGGSIWKDYLTEKGEGLHHIAFHVNNTQEVLQACETFGMSVLQSGLYDDGRGQYTYLDGGDFLNCIIELLEDFN